jgi:long-chain-fatty-acyl-CoA reductase
MSDAVFALPSLVCGEPRVSNSADDESSFIFPDGTITIPRFSEDDLKRVLFDDRTALTRLSIDEITMFFEEVGQRWADPNDEWRRLALDWAGRVTGYASDTVRSDLDFATKMLRRSEQYDFIETDLGDPGLLDEWTRYKAVYQRCWPRGLVAHVMVGNVPLASILTLYRSLATKNQTLAKVPQRDPVTALCFAHCMRSVDPAHPVVRALTVGYWDSESAVEDHVLRSADAVTVWGQGPAIASVKSRLPHGAELIEFGPKRSVGIVLDGVNDWERLSTAQTRDVVAYDQEGCFSLQEVFVETGETVRRVVAGLVEELAAASDTLPRRSLPADVHAHIHRARLEAMAEGWDVRSSDGTDWTVVVTDGPIRVREHPLSRFVYVHPVANVEAALPLLDRDVQTVSLAPWSRLWEVADDLARSGVARIVQPGRMTRFRPGFTHDGMHPMRRMVRWVGIERGIESLYQLGRAAPSDLERARAEAPGPAPGFISR